MNEKPFRLAVGAVVRDDAERFLLLRRSSANQRFGGCWEWPGGKPDPGELFDDAVRREVREETGLEVELLGVAGALDFELPQARIAMLCMNARVVGGTLRLSEEHDDHAWVPALEVPNWNLVPHLKASATAYAARTAR